MQKKKKNEKRAEETTPDYADYVDYAVFNFLQILYAVENYISDVVFPTRVSMNKMAYGVSFITHLGTFTSDFNCWLKNRQFFVFKTIFFSIQILT